MPETRRPWRTNRSLKGLSLALHKKRFGTLALLHVHFPQCSTTALLVYMYLSMGVQGLAEIG